MKVFKCSFTFVYLLLSVIHWSIKHFQDRFRPCPVNLSFFRKWYKDTAVSFGFLNTRTSFLLKALSGKSWGSKCECRIRGLPNMASSSGVARSILLMCSKVTSSIGPVSTSTRKMLVNQ